MSTPWLALIIFVLSVINVALIITLIMIIRGEPGRLKGTPPCPMGDEFNKGLWKWMLESKGGK